MSMVTSPRLHHLALTVTDVDASVRWYEDVFGIRFQMDVPHPGGVGKLLADDGRQLMIVLHRHDANDSALFGESVTGLDHAGFMVPDRSDLEAWQARPARAVVSPAPSSVPWQARCLSMEQEYGAGRGTLRATVPSVNSPRNGPVPSEDPPGSCMR